MKFYWDYPTKECFNIELIPLIIYNYDKSEIREHSIGIVIFCFSFWIEF